MTNTTKFINTESQKWTTYYYSNNFKPQMFTLKLHLLFQQLVLRGVVQRFTLSTSKIYDRLIRWIKSLHRYHLTSQMLQKKWRVQDPALVGNHHFFHNAWQAAFDHSKISQLVFNNWPVWLRFWPSWQLWFYMYHKALKWSYLWMCIHHNWDCTPQLSTPKKLVLTVWVAFYFKMKM